MGHVHTARTDGTDSTLVLQDFIARRDWRKEKYSVYYSVHSIPRNEICHNCCCDCARVGCEPRLEAVGVMGHVHTARTDGTDSTLVLQDFIAGRD